MIAWLRAHFVFAGDPGLVPRTYIRRLTTVIPVLDDLTLWFSRAHMWCTYMPVGKHLIHIK